MCGHTLLELVVGARAQVDRAHPAAPDLAHELVSSHAPPDQQVGGQQVVSQRQRLGSFAGLRLPHQRRIHRRLINVFGLAPTFGCHSLS
jgi:hypothetical protein